MADLTEKEGFMTPEENQGRPVRPHRSGGHPTPPQFRDERLHRIDELMDAQIGTPEGAELDRLVDEQVEAEGQDPARWCDGCGARTQERCKCGPLASND